jgi:hypothetical protein
MRYVFVGQRVDTMHIGVEIPFRRYLYDMHTLSIICQQSQLPNNVVCWWGLLLLLRLSSWRSSNGCIYSQTLLSILLLVGRVGFIWTDGILAWLSVLCHLIFLFQIRSVANRSEEMHEFYIYSYASERGSWGESSERCVAEIVKKNASGVNFSNHELTYVPVLVW